MSFSAEMARERAGTGDPSPRLEAMERFHAAGLPTAEEEVWRYSRIGELDIERFTPAAASTTVEDPDAICRRGDAPPGAPSPDVFAELNTAFSSPLSVRVGAGRAYAKPVVITHDVSGDGGAHFPHLLVQAEEDSEVTVIERFVSRDGDRSLVVPVVRITAGPAARVTYLAINELGDATWQIAHQQAVGERDSNTVVASVALGGDYARVRTEAHLVGRGGSTRQVALYFAGGTQMHDFRTLQDHVAPRTTSDLLFKGAVQDTARSVYTGLIKVRPDAKGTVAFQTNRNLTLSEGAWAESVPNLEIETNDVKCSHASAVGPVDEEQRFYLESRGIPPKVAERLVVLGFFEDVIAQLPAAAAVGSLRQRVAAKLGRADE